MSKLAEKVVIGTVTGITAGAASLLVLMHLNPSREFEYFQSGEEFFIGINSIFASNLIYSWSIGVIAGFYAFEAFEGIGEK